MWRWRYTLVVRTFMLLLIARVCVPVTEKSGGVVAIALIGVAIAAVCGAVGLAMSRQKVGQVTIVNYLAPIVMPWGYRIGRGRIGFYIGESWLRWMLMATGMVVLASRSFSPHAVYRPGIVACVVLFLSWVVVGEVALRLITNLVTRANGNPLPPGTFPPIVGMIAVVLASAGLTLWGVTAGQFYGAMLLTAGPVAVVGGGYGLMLLVFLTFGRNMRWN